MLVDDTLFCGSPNIANPYSGVRYGDQSFRDLNIVMRNQDTKQARQFFLDLLLLNEKFFPNELNQDKLFKMFADLE